MKTIKIVSIIIVAFAFLAYFFYASGINSRVAREAEEKIFTINKGEGTNKISEKLYESGLIQSKFFFEIYVWLKGWEENLQAGEHLLNPSMSIKEIAYSLISGGNPENEIEIKIIEGWNLKDIAEYFEEKGIFSKEEVYSIVGKIKMNYGTDSLKLKDFSGEFEFLSDKPGEYGLEGYLFPDTYRIFTDSSAEDVARKMLSNFDEKLTLEMRENIKEQDKTIYEIITMASIIEKEVRTEEDMKIVSGIFWNRIKNGQPLQSCATLAYILGENKARYTLEDTKIDSPYNTYLISGLPPGPICNPGINAIKAAIYPEDTEYNFFLTSNKDGKTIFSRTLEEHNANKERYLR